MLFNNSSLRRKAVAYSCLLCFAEGIACALWLATIPGDVKNAIIWGLSIQRLFILGVIAFVSFGFLIFSILFWRQEKIFIRFSDVLRKPMNLGRLNLFLGVSFLVILGLLVIPPPGLLPHGSALHQRISPLLLFGVLCLIQAILVIDWLSWQHVKKWRLQTLAQIRSLEPSLFISFGLLLLSAIVSLTQVYYVYYNWGDEGEIITIGWLISKGWVLYKDVFTHHFPLPYFFVALVVKLFGASILPIRLSLIIFRTLAFAISMKFSRYRLALGITALGWSLIGHLYLGNTLVYYSFSGFLLVCSIAIGLTLINEAHQVSKSGLFTMSVFCGLAVMTDPILLFPTTALIVFVMLAILFQKSNPINPRQFIKIGALVCIGYGAGLGCYLAYALITGSLADFYQYALVFNAITYSKYSPPITFTNAFEQLISGLGIFNPYWLSNISPFYVWDSFTTLDAWVFTGFFYRFVILMACFICLLRRRYLIGVATYMVASLIMVRSTSIFYGSSLAFISIFIGAWLLAGDVFSWPKITNRFWDRIRQIAQKTTWAIVLLMFCWLNVRASHFLLENTNRMQYDYYFGARMHDAAFFKQLTCGNNDVRLLIYPYDPIYYFLAQMPPASRFSYMLPWTAEIGQGEVIEALKHKPTVLIINREAEVWGYPVETFLADLLRYIDDHYEKVKNGIYVSPSILPCQ